MISLLFNSVSTSDQNTVSMQIEPKVIEVVSFEVYPGYSKEEAKEALTALNDIIKFYYGFIERITANNNEGKYIDIIYWKDMESAKAAAAELNKNEAASEIFKIIRPETIEMNHFTSFNQFE
ncbi:hypothetical protein [Aquimarina algicola]|uniref:ABM domain-containing protein n=1 Tax=Aquimarina algicola TaxID=2589995 RepID=A0A504JKJ9_9FLAO|nr:hypothetical protein [Aquimarina algicola]TPN88865.1 hypothetical protein FHK87_01225 [Aquimarina algicola]